MKIRHVKITNFRGIKAMEWAVKDNVNCLIGPGDSTKTTILDAIEYTLLSRWSLAFDDSDFYLADSTKPIEIVVTAGMLPASLLSEQKFGLYKRGWNAGNGINDEPKEGDEDVLSVRLRVDSSLEPEWTVICDRNLDGIRISYKDRERFGIMRVGQEVDRHLSWTRGSVLSHLSSNQTDATLMLARISRQAREMAEFEKIEDLNTIAQRTQKEAVKLGVKPATDFLPRFDSKGVVAGIGSISLHDGKVPLRLAGLGTRRLITLALQISCAETGSIILIDEIENGLEPHRIRHLLRLLQQTVDKTGDSGGQIFMTSHSATVIVEVAVGNLQLVRSRLGKTDVKGISSELQGTVRRIPESLLGRKVAVVEGKTEYGLLRTIADYWVSEGKASLATMGVSMIEGNGDESIRRAKHLADLEYTTALLMDSDKLVECQANLDEAAAAGVQVIHWAGAVSTEQRIVLDISWAALKKIVNLAVQWFGNGNAFAQIRSRLEKPDLAIGTDLEMWKQQGFSEGAIRNAIGLAAKTCDWFKIIERAEELARIVVEDWDNVTDKDLALKIGQLQQWIYE